MVGGARRAIWVGFKRNNLHSKISLNPPRCSELGEGTDILKRL